MPIAKESIIHISRITILGVLTGWGLTLAGCIIVKAGIRSCSFASASFQEQTVNREDKEKHIHFTCVSIGV